MKNDEETNILCFLFLDSLASQLSSFLLFSFSCSPFFLFFYRFSIIIFIHFQKWPKKLVTFVAIKPQENITVQFRATVAKVFSFEYCLYVQENVAGFFRRSIRKKRSYECRFELNCAVDKSWSFSVYFSCYRLFGRWY